MVSPVRVSAILTSTRGWARPSVSARSLGESSSRPLLAVAGTTSAAAILARLARCEHHRGRLAGGSPGLAGQLALLGLGAALNRELRPASSREGSQLSFI